MENKYVQLLQLELNHTSKQKIFNLLKKNTILCCIETVLKSLVLRIMGIK